MLIFFFPAKSFAFHEGLVNKNDSLVIREIYDEALVQGEAYQNLHYLCKNIGNRVSGSANAQKAVEWSFDLMEAYQFDTVWLQEIMVPNWKRGNIEKCYLQDPEGHEIKFSITALGGSIGSDGVLTAEVIEVNSLEDLRSRDNKEIEGKIVFINQAFDQRYIRTGSAYSACGGIRWDGAPEAAKKGAVAVINRSLSSKDDDFPHTGSVSYQDSIPKIPAIAISTEGSNYLSQLVLDGNTKMSLELNCKMHPDTISYNVIAEIKGSEYPEKVMVVGGHLDSWDIGEGAHDDGAGVVQSLEVLRIFKALNIQPKHTLRCVFYMNEENGTRGAKAYANWAKLNNDEIPWVAMESDGGGFTPRGFSFQADDIYIEAISAWSDLFIPYYANSFRKGYGGTDIGKLEDQGTVLIGYEGDSQRYFDLHHSANDIFENVNKRELQLGAATMASLLYLIDTHGLPEKMKD
jgi:hypothetical protein